MAFFPLQLCKSLIIFLHLSFSPFVMENQTQKKPRVLCLHGFRHSGEILKTRLHRAWPETVLKKLDMVYLDGPFPAQDKPHDDGLWDPPYYEWFQANKDFTEYTNFEECVKYIEDYMVKNGPFDGILGHSQGALLAGAFPGMQNEGVALTLVPKIKFVIINAGGKFGGPELGMPKLATNAYSSPIDIPSLHLIGKLDNVSLSGTLLTKSFVDPVVIYHPQGHTIPNLDEKQEKVVLGFIKRIQKLV